MVDGDVPACTGRVGLDLDHASAVRREHAVAGGSREVDRLVDLIGAVHVGAGRVARVVGGDDLRGGAGRRAGQRLRAQRAEAAVLHAQLERLV